MPKNSGIRRITIDDPKRRSPWGRSVAINVILRVDYFTSLYRSSANRVRRSDIYDVISPMKFSTRTLLLCVTSIACIFGCIELGRLVFRLHCQSLEPELFSFVLNQKEFGPKTLPDRFIFGMLHERSSDKSNNIAFALGRDAHQRWIDPAQSLLNRMRVENLKPASRAKGGEPIYYISNVDWLDWNTASVDYGYYGYTPPVDLGNKFVLKKNADGWAWINTEAKSGWIRNSKVSYPQR